MKAIVFLSVIFLMTGVRVVYPNSSNAANLIFIHGNIITMNEALPRAEAVAVKKWKNCWLLLDSGLLNYTTAPPSR